MLNVFITVDVEVWPGGWDRIDEKFPDAFQRYVYGPSPRGNYSLPFQLQLLHEHGLRGCFLVEPLFSLRFGLSPLQEIVGLIKDAKQEIQLHMHTEWVDKLHEPILPGRSGMHLRQYSREEQTILLAKGRAQLRAAGIENINAFRAGNFGFNADTLPALAANGIQFDTSYNPCILGPSSGLSPTQLLFQPIQAHGVYEYPVTVYRDRPGHFRHTQITACSFGEMKTMLWQALERGWHSFVIVFHNFELLNMARVRPNPVVVKRFVQLCEFLDRHRDQFQTRGFHHLTPQAYETQPAPLQSNVFRTGWRIAEQAFQRIFVR